MPKSKTKSETATLVSRLGTFSFKCEPEEAGKHVFDKVTKCLGILEIWYVGLKSKRKNGDETWLCLRQRLVDQDIYRPYVFSLALKYYPENVNDIVQNFTKYLLFEQIRSNIGCGEMYCPPELAIILSSYAAQTMYGNYSPKFHTPNCLIENKAIPTYITDFYSVTNKQLEELIIELYKKRTDMSREAAMHSYLDIAQDLDLFGVRHFPIKTTNGQKGTLALDPTGIKFFSPNDIFSPQTAFYMAELKSISFNNTNVTIKLFTPHDLKIELKTYDVSVSRTIFVRLVGYFDLYCRKQGSSEDLKEEAILEAAKTKSIIPDIEQSQSAKSFHKEQKAYASEVAERFKLYEEHFDDLFKEFKKIAKITDKHRTDTIKAYNHQRQAESECRMAEEHKSMLEDQSLITPAKLPALVRGRRQVMKKYDTLKEKTVKASEESARQHQLLMEAKEKEEQALSNLDDFTVHDDILVKDSGITENDNTVKQGDCELDIDEVDFKSPWAGRTPVPDMNEELKHELDVLQKYFKARHKKKTPMDEMYMKTRERGPDKYSIMMDIVKETLSERIRTIENL